MNNNDQFKLDCFTLGITYDFDKDTLKNQYRKLAKQYHPDKPGGSKKTFDYLTNAFERLSNCVNYNTLSYDEMKEDFEEIHENFDMYCNPELSQMMKKSHNKDELQKKFHEEFQRNKLDHAFNDGYGSMMTGSSQNEVNPKTGSREDIPITKTIHPDKYSRKNFNKQFHKNIDPKTNSIIQYNEPQPAQFGGQNVGQVIENEKMINDFSGSMTNVQNGPTIDYSDYKVAYKTSRLVDPSSCKKSKYSKYKNDLETLKKKRDKEVENYDFELSKKHFNEKLQEQNAEIYDRQQKMKKEEKQIENGFNNFSKNVFG